MKKIIRFLSVLLAIMMVVTTLPITSFATENSDWEYVVVSEEDKMAKLTKYLGSESDVVTPTEIDGYSVVSIGNRAFDENDNIINVIISEGVTTLDTNVFYQCENIRYVSFPDGLETIPSSTFSTGSPKLRAVSIPDSVTTIGASAIVITVFPLIVLYSGTEEQWSTVTINSGNSEITEGTIFYEVDNGIPAGECGADAQWELDVAKGVLTISGTGEMKDYKNSTYKAWYDLKTLFDTVVVNDGITYIGQNAFSSLDYVTSISIPKSVISFGTDAFDDCERLKKIEVDINNQWLSSDENGVLFNKEKAEILRYPNYNGVKDYTVPGTVTKIGYGAFSNCTILKSVVISNNVLTLVSKLFITAQSLKM